MNERITVWQTENSLSYSMIERPNDWVIQWVNDWLREWGNM